MYALGEEGGWQRGATPTVARAGVCKPFPDLALALALFMSKGVLHFLFSLSASQLHLLEPSTVCCPPKVTDNVTLNDLKVDRLDLLWRMQSVLFLEGVDPLENKHVQTTGTWDGLT